ncbi:hypothetical protein ACQP6C_02620 [Snodgrassella alvi]|uniref:hypothetical protein n=1 Tax=Snodgrassella alvi TaxID=1196083 RepID=UPI003D008318
MTELNTALKDPSTGLSDNSDKTKKLKYLWGIAFGRIADLFKEAGTIEGDSFEWKGIQELINRKYTEVNEINDVLYRFCTEQSKKIGGVINIVSYAKSSEKISIKTEHRRRNGGSIICSRNGIRLIDLNSYETGYPLLAQYEGRLPRLIFNKSDLERVLNEMIKSEVVADKLQEWERNNFFIKPSISKNLEE